MATGVKETYEVLSCLAKIATAVSAAAADGTINLFDAPKFVEPLKALVEAYQGATAVPAELKDLDAEEKKYLVEKFKEELDLKNDQVEAYVEAGLEAIARLHDAIVIFLPKS